MSAEDVPVTIDLPVPDRPSKKQLGRRRRKTGGGVWTYEVAVDGADSAVLTLRCCEPATVDQSGLHRKFWLVEGGNIVVDAENAYRLVAGPDDQSPRWTEPHRV